jgi:hypothetical protein
MGTSPTREQAPEIRIKHPNIREQGSQSPTCLLSFFPNSTRRQEKELSLSLSHAEHKQRGMLKKLFASNKGFPRPVKGPESSNKALKAVDPPITHGKSFTTDSSGAREGGWMHDEGSDRLPEIQMKRSALLS